jgi:hypothetical protein
MMPPFCRTKNTGAPIQTLNGLLVIADTGYMRVHGLDGVLGWRAGIRGHPASLGFHADCAESEGLLCRGSRKFALKDMSPSPAKSGCVEVL